MSLILLAVVAISLGLYWSLLQPGNVNGETSTSQQTWYPGMGFVGNGNAAGGAGITRIQYILIHCGDTYIHIAAYPIYGAGSGFIGDPVDINIWEGHTFMLGITTYKLVSTQLGRCVIEEQ